MFADLSYAGVLAVLVAVNTAPILMPPTWIILSSFYAADPSFNPVYLALVGATGATAGRFILQRISGQFRKFVQGEQKSNLDYKLSWEKKFGYCPTRPETYVQSNAASSHQSIRYKKHIAWKRRCSKKKRGQCISEFFFPKITRDVIQV